MMRGMNMQQMMKQAKKMQQKMMEEQQNLAKEEFIGVSPDEMVKATFTGDKKLTDLQIDPQAVDPDDVDMLADLVLAAVNDKARYTMSSRYSLPYDPAIAACMASMACGNGRNG